MLGIIDWGIGGVSIYKLMKDELGVAAKYFSDTGATPYGKMSRRELTARLDVVIQFLKSRGVTHVVIGCNAASTAIPHLADHGIPVEGVIEPAVRLTAKLKPKKLALIGGRRTVLSGVYREAFTKRGIAVTQRIAQPLSALIESGDVSSEHLRQTAKTILAPIRDSSHILLACTHYPAITPVLRSLVSENTTFIDPAAEMVKIVEKWRLPNIEDDVGDSEFFTSGDPRSMTVSAKRAFDVDLPVVAPALSL